MYIEMEMLLAIKTYTPPTHKKKNGKKGEKKKTHNVDRVQV